MSSVKSCERCKEPLLINHGKTWFEYWDDNLKQYRHRHTKTLCFECMEIAEHASSPESCGDPVIRTRIQQIAKRTKSNATI